MFHTLFSSFFVFRSAFCLLHFQYKALKDVIQTGIPEKSEYLSQKKDRQKVLTVREVRRNEKSVKIFFYFIKHFICGIRLSQKFGIICPLLPDGGIFNKVLQDFFAAVGR